MKRKIIVPTGYMGSGSSAVTDLLREISCFENNNGSFEFIFMHCPDGLFDLEDKLLYGNNAIRSDEAIHRFRAMMLCLYKCKNYWPGMYKEHISSSFIDYVDEFIGQLTTAEFVGLRWHFSEKPDGVLMQVRHYFRRIVKKLSLGKLNLSIPVKYKTMHIAFPDKDSFYEASRGFLGHIFSDLGIKEHNLVMDQLILPHNLYRLNNYFDDNVRVIVVDRDPRDVFVLNKYRWTVKGDSIPYPLDVEEFIRFYRAMRLSESVVQDDKILRIHFEDLVYNYQDTINKLYSFLGVNSKNHKNKKMYFDPNISINNTQLFNINDSVKLECDKIAEELEEYLYQFPYGKESPIVDKLF